MPVIDRKFSTILLQKFKISPVYRETDKPFAVLKKSVVVFTLT